TYSRIVYSYFSEGFSVTETIIFEHHVVMPDRSVLSLSEWSVALSHGVARKRGAHHGDGNDDVRQLDHVGHLVVHSAARRLLLALLGRLLECTPWSGQV